MTGLRQRLFYRGERGGYQQLADNVVDDLAVLLALGAACNPVRIGLKRGPFLFAIGERIPGDEIGQLLIGGADQRGVEAGLLDAVLVPQFQRQRIEALHQRRQAARQAAIDAHFHDHWGLLRGYCAAGYSGCSWSCLEPILRIARRGAHGWPLAKGLILVCPSPPAIPAMLPQCYWR